ncbi:very short patch repair endonuclease [Dyadobacter sp. Leaf189]|uniref:very short patch repair endonuclease n=1 Tax=Dyadobacter sp. Leaf189 TaxID=1736295 RepID=UPI001910B84D|nr:DNA mismatch endonuclease Vsr [Dyadobacter sp. Leaf189]
MSQIRSKDTKPEITVRKVLHSLGLRFRLGRTDIPGKPDIVLPKYKTAIYVHGCFWHRHNGCKYAYTPKSKMDFWNGKFAANIKRDNEISEKIKSTQWVQLIIWECDTRDKDRLTKILKEYFYDTKE